MSDDEFLVAFEGRSLAPGTFHHPEHVRVAFAYLSRYDLFETLGLYRRGLKRFATHAGAPGKYHETVTCALVVLVQERMTRQEEGQDWETFAAANPDLLAWKDGVFFDYYGADVLDCELARRTFILPGPSQAPATP